ncbi:hypothetical protein [Psychromonas ingrahamii]|uniref:hypothetical protein n=1 Tax=Psychromonas ingrahamii TaxID=357794 RepID=UPI0038CD4B5E
MSYGAKLSSGYYETFCDFSASNPIFGDRASYQMNQRNHCEAISYKIKIADR